MADAACGSLPGQNGKWLAEEKRRLETTKLQSAVNGRPSLRRRFSLMARIFGMLVGVVASAVIYLQVMAGYRSRGFGTHLTLARRGPQGMEPPRVAQVTVTAEMLETVVAPRNVRLKDYRLPR